MAAAEEPLHAESQTPHNGDWSGHHGPTKLPERQEHDGELVAVGPFLDQYRLASGHPMPDDLVVSTVMRCVDINVRKHLELTMDDSLDYQQLKERLIVMDKNSRAWSGDTYLRWSKTL